MDGKILIIDDNPDILTRLAAGLARPGLEVLKAREAKAGLELLGREQVDVLISDFRMADMDGLQFLREVRKSFPAVHRLLMSGFLDRSLVMRFISSGLVETFIPKPWDGDFLRTKIEHILAIRARLQEKKLIDLINSIEKLPTLPYLYRELILAIEENRSMAEIAEVVKKDPSVAAKILHVVNSAFFGREDISEIKEAVIYLGESVLKDIVLTTRIVDCNTWSPKQIRHLKELFFHSFLVNKYLPGIYKLSHGKPLGSKTPSVGVIHDIGKLLILQFFPDRFERIAALEEGDFYEREESLGYVGCAHTEIGAYFLDWWNFPEVMVEAALFHHHPERASAEYWELLRVTRLTDKLVHRVLDQRKAGQPELADFPDQPVSREILQKIAVDMLHTVDRHPDLIDQIL